MITGNHPRCKWILIPPPYVHSFIWMTMYVPYHKDNISMAGPRGFVKIVRLYLLTTDIWICWFHRFAFVKPSYLHLQTSDINSSFGAALDFSRKKVLYFPSPIICIFIQVISTFVRACCFLHCSSIRIHPSKPFSLNTSCWVIDGCCFPFFNKQFATV